MQSQNNKKRLEQLHKRLQSSDAREKKTDKIVKILNRVIIVGCILLLLKLLSSCLTI